MNAFEYCVSWEFIGQRTGGVSDSVFTKSLFSDSILAAGI